MVRPKTSLWSLFPLLLTMASPGKAADCQKPTLEGNVVLTNEAILKNEFPDGSDITLECSTGYEVDHGSEIMTCTSGVWTVPNLICKKKDCGPPKPLPNGKFEMPNGTVFGATIKPLCDRGYMLQGSSYRQCLAHGWVGRPRCLLITCEKPAEIANGVITRRPDRDQPVFEDVIEYSCEPSYTLIGSSSIFCQDDGEYSSLPPMCKETTTIATATTTTTAAAAAAATTTTTTAITICTSHSSTSTTAPLSRSIPHNLKVIGPVIGIGMIGLIGFIADVLQALLIWANQCRTGCLIPIDFSTAQHAGPAHRTLPRHLIGQTGDSVSHDPLSSLVPQMASLSFTRSISPHFMLYYSFFPGASVQRPEKENQTPLLEANGKRSKTAGMEAE
ncbi:hypothetical protein NFI96_011264, partial [Prochilodus magdalenae]